MSDHSCADPDAVPVPVLTITIFASKCAHGNVNMSSLDAGVHSEVQMLADEARFILAVVGRSLANPSNIYFDHEEVGTDGPQPG